MKVVNLLQQTNKNHNKLGNALNQKLFQDSDNI